MGQLGWDASILGFGTMRLPTDKLTGKIDYAESTRMIRYAIDNGINYVDTAWMYHNEQSELFLGKALNDGYREKIKLVSKSPVWLIRNVEDFYSFFTKQLENLNSDYLDVYLLHGLTKSKWEKVKELNLLKEMGRLKAAGKIKHIGFSFHDSYETFKEITDFYKWDVVLLQYNYLDTDYEVTEKGLDYAYNKNIPVVVMEPLRGGKLAQNSEETDKIIGNFPEKRTPAEWSFRFVWNHPGVCCVLSGMSNLEQLQENIRYAETAPCNSLSEEESEIIEQLKVTFLKKIKLNCTGCRYCTPCSQGVDIPENFNLLNAAAWEGKTQGWMLKWYKELDDEGITTDWHGKGKASLCIQCGECIDKCPQKINIPEELENVVKVFEEGISINEV